MFIDSIKTPEGTELKANDENFNLIVSVLQTQLTLMRQPIVLRLCNKMIEKRIIRFIDTRRKAPLIDAKVFDGFVNIYVPVSIYMNQGFNSVNVFRKLALAIVFGAAAFLMKGKILPDKQPLVNFMFSLFLSFLANYQQIIIKDARVLALFNIAIVRYIFSILFKEDIPKGKIRPFLTNYDSAALAFAYEKFPNAIKDSNELNKRLIDLGLMDSKVSSAKKLLPFTRFQQKTLFSLERLNYLYATLFVIQFFTDGVFDDFLSKINHKNYKVVVKDIEEFLSKAKIS